MLLGRAALKYSDGRLYATVRNRHYVPYWLEISRIYSDQPPLPSTAGTRGDPLDSWPWPWFLTSCGVEVAASSQTLIFLGDCKWRWMLVVRADLNR
jgi:hypothetical protein